MHPWHGKQIHASLSSSHGEEPNQLSHSVMIRQTGPFSSCPCSLGRTASQGPWLTFGFCLCLAGSSSLASSTPFRYCFGCLKGIESLTCNYDHVFQLMHKGGGLVCSIASRVSPSPLMAPAEASLFGSGVPPDSPLPCHPLWDFASIMTCTGRISRFSSF